MNYSAKLRFVLPLKDGKIAKKAYMHGAALRIFARSPCKTLGFYLHADI